jgi:hypothetical protein
MSERLDEEAAIQYNSGVTLFGWLLKLLLASQSFVASQDITLCYFVLSLDWYTNTRINIPTCHLP